MVDDFSLAANIANEPRDAVFKVQYGGEKPEETTSMKIGRNVTINKFNVKHAQ